MPPRRGGICGKLTRDLPSTRLQGGLSGVDLEDAFVGSENRARPVLPRNIQYEKTFDFKKSGNEVYYTF